VVSDITGTGEEVAMFDLDKQNSIPFKTKLIVVGRRVF
jgi:hypothetical protein